MLPLQVCKDDESGARALASHCLEGAQAPATHLGIPAGLVPTPTAATQPTPTSSKVRNPHNLLDLASGCNDLTGSMH